MRRKNHKDRECQAITEVLFKLFRQLDFNNHLHVCMRALFLVAFFLFLRITNLVPYKFSDIADPQACHLMPANVTFASHGTLLRITHTKTIQFYKRQLEIPLPCIPGSPLCLVTVLQQKKWLPWENVDPACTASQREIDFRLRQSIWFQFHFHVCN